MFIMKFNLKSFFPQHFFFLLILISSNLFSWKYFMWNFFNHKTFSNELKLDEIERKVFTRNFKTIILLLFVVWYSRMRNDSLSIPVGLKLISHHHIVSFSPRLDFYHTKIQNIYNSLSKAIALRCHNENWVTFFITIHLTTHSMSYRRGGEIEN
jgi:hypothetical protein